MDDAEYMVKAIQFLTLMLRWPCRITNHNFPISVLAYGPFEGCRKGRLANLRSAGQPGSRPSGSRISIFFVTCFDVPAPTQIPSSPAVQHLDIAAGWDWTLLQSALPKPGDQFDLHCDVEGQFCETHGTAGVTSCVAEDIHEQVGASIDNSRSLIEPWCDIDHPEDFYDAGDAVKIAEIGSQGGEDGQRSHSRRLSSLFDGKVPSDLSADDVVAVYGTVTGDIHDAVVNYTSEVVACGREDRGKRDAEFLESLIDHM
jgi:hypothetical protein